MCFVALGGFQGISVSVKVAQWEGEAPPNRDISTEPHPVLLTEVEYTRWEGEAPPNHDISAEPYQDFQHKSKLHGGE